MPAVDPVVLELLVRDGEYISKLRNAERVAGNATDRMQSQFTRSSAAISSSLRNVAGAFAAAFSAREIARLSDGYTRLRNNLRVAGLEGAQLAGVQQQLLNISQQYGTDLEGLTSVFLRASMAQNELGASTQQIVELNQIIAASLKVTGTSAQQASGALLQLGQALGSGVVRAEEFNSILEGALPLAQAAARGIDGMGGSVAKLRAAVADGNVTSRQFFEGVLKGGVQTLADAEKATLTLSGGFTALTSALTVYIGEADKAFGASAAIGEGLKALADNLDTIIPALTAIAVGLGVGFVTNAARANLAANTTAASFNHMTLQATRGTTALTAMGVAGRRAGAGLLAAFGGPVGLAITAVGAALYIVAGEASQAANAVDEMNKRAETASEKADDMERRLRAAGVAVDELGNKGRNAARGVDELTRSMEAAIRRAKELEDVSGLTRVRDLEGQIREASSRTAAAQRAVDQTHPNMMGSLIGRRRQETLQAARAEEEALRRQLRLQTLGMRHGVSFEDTPTGSPPPPGKPKKPKKPTGPTAAEIAQRHEEEMSRLRQEELQAQIDLATDARDRADLQMDALREEYALRSAQLAADEHFTAEQKKAQQAALDRLYGLVRATDGTITVGGPGLLQQRIRADLDEELADLQREELRRRHDQLALEADALYARADIADTLEQRRFLENSALAIQQQIERELLDQAIAEGRVTEAAEARALLAQRQSAEATSLERRNQGAFGRYLDSTADPRAQAEDAAVREMENLRDGLADGLASQLGVKNDFVKSMLAIFLDQNLFRPMAEALGGEGGLFSIGMKALGVPGFATGGSMRLGGRGGVDQNLLSLNGQPLARVSRGEVMNISPNQRLGRRPSSVVVSAPQFDLRGAVVTPQLYADMERISKEAAAAAAGKAYQQAVKDAPNAIQSKQRYGS